MLNIRRTVDTKAALRASIVTAHIIYHVPDRPVLLQDFIWQKEDEIPTIPRLREFLDFWVEKIDGPLHSVTVMHARLIKPKEIPLAHLLN